MKTLRRTAGVRKLIFLVLLVTAFCHETRAVNYLVVWGDNRAGQVPAPPGLTNVVGLGAGTLDSAVDSIVNSDGTVTVWGCCTNRSVIPAGVTNVIAVAQGNAQNLALKSDGTVVAWGGNPHGEGVVPAGISNVVAIAAASYHNVVLKSNGTVAAWGISDPSTNVPNGLNGVMAVGASYLVSLALGSNGMLVPWGPSLSSYPPAGLSNLVAISGTFLALKNDGKVVAWGDNSYGQTNIPAGLSNVMAIAGNGAHNVVLKSNRTIVAWGRNDYGQSSVPPGLTNVMAVAVSGATSLAITSINDGSPVITSHPNSQSVYSGTNVTFVALADGIPAPSLQWQHNGTNLPGATTSTLTIVSAQTNDNGSYVLVASNVVGTAMSLPATLTATNSPPVVIGSPSGPTVFAGGTIALSPPIIFGSSPFSYQWCLNSVAVPGATNISLVITNAQASNQGSYTLVVSNAYGPQTSSVFIQNVIDLNRALNTTNYNWISSGDLPWIPVSTTVHTTFSDYAAQSGAITNNQSSSLTTTVTGPGLLTFWWRVSSQPTNDYLSFSTNGVELARISGTPGWASKTYNLASGAIDLQWRYVKDASGSGGQDAAWLDQVTFTPGPTAPSITSPMTSSQNVPLGTAVTLSITALGTPALNYQWQHNGTNLNGATSPALGLSNVQLADSGTYRVIVSNDYGAATNSGTISVFPFVGPTQPQDALDRWYFRDPTPLTTVKFVGGIFLGVGTNGTLMTSTNGSNWIKVATGVTDNLTGAAYATTIQQPGKPFAIKYVVVGGGGTVLGSPDGVTWTNVSPGLAGLNSVMGAINRFVATTSRVTTNQPNTISSTDGFQWTGTTFTGGGSPSGGAYTSSAIGIDDTGILVTAGGTEFAYDIWKSSSLGSSWTSPAFSDQVVTGIAYGNGRFVLVGWEGWPRISTNHGAVWFSSTASIISPNAGQPPNYAFPMVGSDVTFGNGIFLVARSFLQNGFLTTPDGTNWAIRGPFYGTGIESVAYGNGTFVAVSSGGAYPPGIYQSMSVTAPILTVTPQTNSPAFTITMSGESGRAYRLQSSADLVSWGDRMAYTNTGALVQFSDPLPPGPAQRFYRVVSP